jgi:hypothetical protein
MIPELAELERPTSLRWLGRTALLMLAALALSSACSDGKTYSCEGDPRPCTWLLPETCAIATGCFAVEVPACEPMGFACVPANVEGTTCASATCYEDGPSCRPICEQYADRQSCEATTIACIWAEDRCTTECGLLPTLEACDQGRNCAWASCAGTPRACDRYSGDECPTHLGCERVTHHAISAQ